MLKPVDPAHRIRFRQVRAMFNKLDNEVLEDAFT